MWTLRAQPLRETAFADLPPDVKCMGKVSTAGRRNAAQLVIFGQISALAIVYYSIR
jgi:hypothetical protein